METPCHSDGAEHALADPWTLYAHGAADAIRYHSSIHYVTTITSCEDWGRVWNNVPFQTLRNVDKAVVVHGTRVNTWSLFRRNTEPEWEHPDNHGGTTLTYRVGHPHDVFPTWRELMVECVRGASPPAVLGIQVTQKKGRNVRSRFDVWLRASPPEALRAAQQWLHTITNFYFEVTPREIKL